MRTAIILLALFIPGCLATALAGTALVISSSNSDDTARDTARMEYVASRRSDGATEAEILADIKAFYPQWYEDIEDAGLPE